MNTNISNRLYQESLAKIPGGVNSPVRAFRSVGGNPLFIERGEGAWIIDVDGNRFLDCVCSWGPLIFGHAHPRIAEALRHQLTLGWTFGAPTELELRLAEIITNMVPSVEKVRFVSSGTEATMSAIRLARGFTKRNKIIKFEGCYHGHADCLLAKSGSGIATLGLPDSAGVPCGTTSDTIPLPYNDVDAVRKAFEDYGADIAGVIVEPIAGNMGCVPPMPSFLQSLRDITSHFKALLIFDEVMTGFRVAKGGAQELYHVKPDITTFGKIVGGGLPVGVYGGGAEIMDMVAPVGPVYQAGTLSGNPLAITAGLETLMIINEDPGMYSRLEETSRRVAQEWRLAAHEAGVRVTINQIGSMFTLFFADGPVRNYAQALTSDTEIFSKFFRLMQERQIYYPPSQYECAFLSAAMGDGEIEHLIRGGSEALISLGKQ